MATISYFFEYCFNINRKIDDEVFFSKDEDRILTYLAKISNGCKDRRRLKLTDRKSSSELNAHPLIAIQDWGSKDDTYKTIEHITVDKFIDAYPGYI